MTKADLVEKIADVIISRKLPHLLDVRDESTTDVRIVLEIKKDADPEAGDGATSTSTRRCRRTSTST